MEQERKTNVGNRSTNISEASENPPEGNASIRSVLIRVGGVIFSLDETTITKFNSDTLLNLLKSSQRPTDGIYEVEERDAECFSAFLHMARFGSIPMNLISRQDKKKLLTKEANYWGVRSLVDEVASRDRDLFRTSYSSKLEELKGKPPKARLAEIRDESKERHGHEEEGSI